MSWNIQKPGDYINGPLTVTGAAIVFGTIQSNTDVRVRKTGSDTFASGPFFYLNSGDGSNNGSALQLNATNGLDFWNSTGGVWTRKMTLDINGNLGVAGNGTCRVYAQKDGAGGANSNTTGSAFGACHAQASSNDLSFAVRCTGSTLAGIGGQSYATQLITNSANANAFEIYTIGNIPLIFGTAGGERARFNPTGAFVLAGGATGANGIGIAFPSAQSASTDANTLDDYEEGTWTASLTFSTTPQTNTHQATGRYTKIGRVVHVQFYLLIGPSAFVKGSAAGNLTITGLPFAAGVAITQYQDFAASLADMSAGSLCFCSVSAGGTSMSFESMSVSGAAVQRNFAAITAANFASTNAGFIGIQFNLTYVV